jgi:hypothetical protein
MVLRFLGNVHVLTKCWEYKQQDYLINQFWGGYSKVYTTAKLGFRVLVLLESETQIIWSKTGKEDTMPYCIYKVDCLFSYTLMKPPWLLWGAYYNTNVNDCDYYIL